LGVFPKEKKKNQIVGERERKKEGRRGVGYVNQTPRQLRRLLTPKQLPAAAAAAAKPGKQARDTIIRASLSSSAFVSCRVCVCVCVPCV
jgi:hypothetical protein